MQLGGGGGGLNDSVRYIWTDVNKMRDQRPVTSGK